MSEMLNSSQLKWRCRRGMLELDIILNAFVENKSASLTIEQLETFYNLLDYPDQVLLDLLMEKTRAADVDVAALIKNIRASMA